MGRISRLLVAVLVLAGLAGPGAGAQEAEPVRWPQLTVNRLSLQGPGARIEALAPGTVYEESEMGTYGTADGLVMVTPSPGEPGKLLGLLDGELQAYFDSDGNIKWAGGKGALDRTGIHLIYDDANAKIEWVDAFGGTQYGEIRMYSFPGPGHVMMLENATSANGHQRYIEIVVGNNTGSNRYIFGIGYISANNSRITAVADATAATDALNRQTGDARYAPIAGAHAAVTLATDAQAILNLSTQEIGLVAQPANRVFAGPASGADADPTMRALVAADIPALSYISLPASPEQGDVLYYNGSGWVRLGHGSAGQVLVSGGHGANPAWGSAGVTDHGALSGLTPDDDHTQYVLLGPGASARNVIQPSGAAYVPLTVKGAASQSANLQEWQRSDGKILGTVTAAGGMRAGIVGAGGLTHQMEVQGGHLNFVSIPNPSDAGIGLALAGVAGNVDNGTHYYTVTYVTAHGETTLGPYATNSIVVTDKTLDGQVLLTNIPISSDPAVTGRNIYRSYGTSWDHKLLVTISNNTDTTYTDNIANSSLPAVSRHYNDTAGKIYLNGIKIQQVSPDTVFLGLYAGYGYTGYYSTAVGAEALRGGGTESIGIGFGAGYFATPASFQNCFIGNSAGYNNNGFGNLFVGYQAGYSNTGYSNVFVGYQAGYNETGSNKLYIANSNTATPLVLGHFGDKWLKIHGAFFIPLADAVTNTITTLQTLQHSTSGTPAAGFGARMTWQLESSTTADQDAAAIDVVWNDATHATRKADLVLSAYDTAQREGLRIRGAGSAAAIGLYGATPVVRATTGGSAATFVQNSGNAVNDASTFDGYTLLQVVKALRDIGVLT